MVGPLNLNIGSSVVKREGKTLEQVESIYLNKGWTKTGEVAGGRVLYFENAGINITVISGAMGVLIVPSGPVRGRIFGEEAVTLNMEEPEAAVVQSEAEDNTVDQKARSTRVNPTHT